MVMDNVRIAAPSDWVDIKDWHGIESNTTKNGVNVLISDTQVNISGEIYEHYSHQVEQALSTQALEEIGHFTLDFNPSFQTVVVHQINVWRDNKIVWSAKLNQFDVLRREKDIEKRILDGRLSVNLLIPAIRVGDVIDWSYSLNGAHPIVGEELFLTNLFAWSRPTAWQRLRLMSRLEQKIKISRANDAPIGVETLEGDIKTTSFIVENTKIAKYEGSEPPGYMAGPNVVLTTEASWNDIAQIFRPAYETEQEIPLELMKLTDALVEATNNPQEIVLTLLRFVQSEIRYFAISIGEGGMVPRELNEIWESRYGDCKDKSLLLSRLLRHYKIDSSPALTNSFLGEFVDDLPPRIYAFDHCIVRVKISDEIRYFDPTFLKQSGDWQNITTPWYAKALPLIDEAELESIISGAIPHVVEANEKWEITSDKSPKARVKITTIWRNYMADGPRSRLNFDGLQALADEYLDYYDRQYRGALRLEDTIINDNQDRNELEIIETYEFGNAFTLDNNSKNHHFVWRPENLIPDFMINETNQRNHPIYLGVPRRISRTAVFNLPYEHGATWQPTSIASSKWSFRNEWATNNGRILRITNDFTCEGGQIAASQAPELFENIRKADSVSGFQYAVPTKDNKMVHWFSRNWLNLLWATVMIIYMIAAFALN